ncbi:MAG: hypothetical protein ACP5MG_06130 [Verrucomicrobiia bacterium]
MFALRKIAAIAIAAFTVTLAATAAISLGPLYNKSELTLSEGWRSEWFGPLFYHELNEETETIAVPPLFSYFKNDSVDYSGFDIIYPAIGYRRYGDEFRYHLFQFFSISGGTTGDNESSRRFTIFPFYFHQWSQIPEENYTAFVPFYGTLKNRLLWDEVNFILFPLYSKTKKRDVITENYLVPIFHIRRGLGLKGWQVFPIYGEEHKSAFSFTNKYEEVEISPGHNKRFVFWPLYLESTSGIGTTNQSFQRAILPFFSYQESELRRSITAPWPIGLTLTRDDEKRYREIGAPWPLIVIARGEGKTITRFWPLYGAASNPYKVSNFYLWPAYKYNFLRTPSMDVEKTRLFFFLYSDAITINTESGDASRRTSLWPLFIQKIDNDGKERLISPALLEPIFPSSSAIARNYSPLWGLCREEKNPAQGKYSKSLFWNLLREDKNKDKEKSSFLFGLFQYEKSAESKKVKIFHITVTEKKAEKTKTTKQDAN